MARPACAPHRTVVYRAGETSRQKLQYDVGQRTELMVPLGSDAKRVDAGGANTFTVTTPSGQREVVAARFVGKMALVVYENTEVPGHYVFQGMGGEFVRAVNVATRESERNDIEPRDLAQQLGLEAGLLRDPSQLEQHIREARHGKELYKIIAGLVLILLVFELLVSRAGGAAATASVSQGIV